jgi:signal transduction histidine kinase
VVAHEIRTPLNGVLGAIQMMQFSLEKGGGREDLASNLALANVRRCCVCWLTMAD